MSQRPKLTAAKADRALLALVAIIETGAITGNTAAEFDRVCDELRRLRDSA